MTELAPGSVTTADLYREIIAMRAEVAKALTRIEVIDSRNNAADKLHSDYETRLRSLEAFRWKMAGLSLSVSAVIGTVSGIVAAHVH